LAAVEHPPTCVALVTHEGGAHVSQYLTAIRDLDRIHDAVVVDEDGSVFDQAREVLNSKLRGTYDSVDAMLQHHHPVMAIVTGSGRRAPGLIRPLLNSGIHITAEKPACINPDDFAALVALADANSAHLMLALGNRLKPWVQDARRICRQDGIGTLYAIRGMTLADQTRIWNADWTHQPWAFKKSEGGGGHLIWLGIHWVDLILYLTGDHITEVQAMAPNVGGGPIDVEDLALVNFRMASGTHGSLVSGYLLDRWYQQDMAIWGSGGWMRYHIQHNGTAEYNELEWHGTQPAMNENPDRTFKYDEAIGDGGYTPLVRATLRAALGETAAPITGAEGLEALRVIFAAYESAHTNRTITLH